MTDYSAYTFTAELQIIGINPFVAVPPDILERIFQDSGKRLGPISICGKVNSKPYKQTLIKYKGEWRLYINTVMLPNSPKRIAENLEISVAFDHTDRTVQMPILFQEALENDKIARKVFDSLPPSLQKEINRYLNSAKKEETLLKNIHLAIGFLKGENRFIGRNPIKK